MYAYSNYTVYDRNIKFYAKIYLHIMHMNMVYIIAKVIYPSEPKRSFCYIVGVVGTVC